MAFPSIGNDIVDLRWAPTDLHPRFVSRVFSEAEQKLLGSGPAALWLHWAAKEAAYKTVKRIEPSIIFAHAKFEFSPSESCVHFGKYRLPCIHRVNEDYVYVVAATELETLEAQNIHSWIDIWPDRTSSSINLRESAIKHISELLELPAAQLEIGSLERTDSGPEWTNIPCLLVNGQKRTDLLSFSHDERYTLVTYYR